MAHARVSTIDLFETSLRENTPLVSISDPAALVEYLNQLNLKGDMVLEELKRVSSERDSFKLKLEEAEKSTREAWDEVAKIREEKLKNPAIPVIQDGPNIVTGLASQENTNLANGTGEGHPLGVTTESPSVSTKSRTPSISSISLFSPRSKPTEQEKVEEESEEFFSYDSELPRLENELKEKQTEVKDLKGEVENLKGDLAVARESTQSMVQTLEVATRESNILREQKERHELDLAEHTTSSQQTIDRLEQDLEATDGKLRQLEVEKDTRCTLLVAELEEKLRKAMADLEKQKKSPTDDTEGKDTRERLQGEIASLRTEVSNFEMTKAQQQKRIDTLNGLVTTLRQQLTTAQQDMQSMISQLDTEKAHADAVRSQLTKKGRNGEDTSNEAAIQKGAARSGDILPSHPKVDTSSAVAMDSAAKKKSKKKKKGMRNTPELVIEEPEQNTRLIDSVAVKQGTLDTNEAASFQDSANTISKLQEELDYCRTLIAGKDAAIDRLHGRLKTEEDLREEIDSLRDDLVNLGQEHVESKDKVKDLLSEKGTLEDKVAKLEKELRDLQAVHASTAVDSEQAQNDLAVQFEDLKNKATMLQTDLSVAQQLASSRFKDLSDLRSILQKAQPELVALRSEVTDLKSVKDEIVRKSTDLQRLEARQEVMRFDLTELRKIAADRESEVKTLNQKIAQETSNRLKVEEDSNGSAQELQRMKEQNRHITEALDKMSKELVSSREDLVSSRSRVREVERQVDKLDRDVAGLKEETELKTAQYASAQSLMSSMRDQTTEMAMQTKEARERSESLEEEVADAHRLLGERSREGETMRRLLAEVEGRADSRVREMKERMDVAIDERDRAENEASTIGRRRARELEELRIKVRDVERILRRTEEDKEELEIAQRDWKRRREELDQKTEKATQEAEEVRSAMSELRDALDESEKQVRDLEKQKAELRRSVEETQHRLDKLQKSNKVCAGYGSGFFELYVLMTYYMETLTDELRSIQVVKTKATDVGVHSSRSSLDSGPSRFGLNSPTPNSRASSTTLLDGPNGHPATSIDYVYLKNILLQFLEQKDKKLQTQLIPVLGMLLHFDR